MWISCVSDRNRARDVGETVSLLKERIAAEAHAASTGGVEALTSLPGQIEALMARQTIFPVNELDALFRSSSLGIRLEDYCSAYVLSSAGPDALTIKRGLAQVEKGERLEALTYFKALSDLADQVDLDKERGRPLHAKQYSVIFYGNPGTGKTTVARIYAKVLMQLGIIPRATVVETSGAKLISGEESELLTSLNEGGVLFVDEAAQLKPKTDRLGARVLELLLPEMENRRGASLACPAASRWCVRVKWMTVHEFTFPDYSDSELTDILKGIIKADPADLKMVDERHGAILCERLGRGSNNIGLGNARAVRNAWERTLEWQAARLQAARRSGLNPNVYVLTRKDLLGPKEVDLSGNKALAELAEMVGMDIVKQQFASLFSIIHINIEREELNKPELGLWLTSLAPTGESEQKTASILDAAIGCVLVIDEAHGLKTKSTGYSNDPYRAAVISTIVSKVQGVPGDDRCVMLLGYEEDMVKMMREADQGLARHFQMQEACRFPDFTPEELFVIMQKAALRRGWPLGEDELLAGIEALNAESRLPNFGNAGAVHNLLSNAALRMEKRLVAQGKTAKERALKMPSPDDMLPPRTARTSGGSDDMIGMGNVLAKLAECRATIEGCKRLGKDPLSTMELNFRFVGVPGTGKTTSAGLMGEMFFDLNLLGSPKVHKCSVTDLVAGWVGQTGLKTRLFSGQDAGRSFHSEAVGEIVQMLTEEKFKNKMVVIFAGYEEKIEALMTSNPGLKSRFSQSLVFPDLSCKDACTLFDMRLGKEYGLSPEAQSALPGYMEQLMDEPGWTWAMRTFVKVCLRLTGDAAKAPASASEADHIAYTSNLDASFLDFMTSKKAKGSSARLRPGPPQSEEKMQQEKEGLDQMYAADAEPAVAQSGDTAAAADAAEEGEAEGEGRDEGGAPRGDFGGLGQEFLAGLQGVLETMGYNLSSQSEMAKLADDVSLPGLLAYSMIGVGGAADIEASTKMVVRWQAALKEQVATDEETKERKQRPVWRCAACGRYGCLVAPYIERMEEVDE
ncbi:hypothetical protein FOA52_002577 [Chlamydomonas sp. UWO 241]|nr:hypothetical protein FOA52_002577 [Chlamydomonas sp. UWO 241]